MKRFFLIGLLISHTAYPKLLSEKKSLQEAYKASLQRSESLAIQLEIIAQAKEDSAQAIGAMLPSISASASYGREAFIVNPAMQNSQSMAKLNLSQPLFRGLREYAAMRQKEGLAKAKEFELQDAARKLYYDVATAYFAVISLTQDKKNYLIAIDLNKKRLAELEKFYKIGRSQLTDLLTLKGGIASLLAQLEGLEGQLQNAKDSLAFFTEWPADTPLSHEHDNFKDLTTLNTFLDKIDERPDIKNAKALALANEELIPMSRSGHFPTLDLNADFYLKYPGQRSDMKWDVSIVATLPIYNGGMVSSEVRQAQSAQRQSALLLSAMRRAADQEIRQFYNAVSADQKQLARLKDLVVITKENWETESSYFRNGLVTNLEVIQSMTNYQDAKRQLDHQAHTLSLDYQKLKAASGQIEEIFIQPTYLAKK